MKYFRHTGLNEIFFLNLFYLFMYYLLAALGLSCGTWDPFFFLINNYFIYLFIYLFIFGCVGSSFRARAFSSCGKRGPLFIAVRGPFTIATPPVAGHRLQTRRLSSCGSRA